MKLLNNKPVKTFLKVAVLILLVYFLAVGFYKKFTDWQYGMVKEYVEEKEATRIYDRDLEYLMPLGEPIFMVKPGNKSTLIFIEGFRGQAGAGIYKDWFRELHEKHGVNIVAPIIGMQGWRFRYRVREWTHYEDMRQILQIYDAYTANLPKDHRVVIGSQSFGTLANVTINAKAKRAPYASVFCAPLNTGLEYKSGGAAVKWLATQSSWLQYVMPYFKRVKNPNRAGLWDIADEDLNRQAWENLAKDIINWEETIGSSVQVQEVARCMENDLLPQIKGRKLFICYGDDDLYFSQAGFDGFAETLKKSGNEVTVKKYANAGHMVLFDRSGPEIKGLFLNLLTK